MLRLKHFRNGRSARRGEREERERGRDGGGREWGERKKR
jgi:hypothetical protein